MGLATIQTLFDYHEAFLRKYLDSDIMRRDDEVVPAYLINLKLQNTIAVRFIFLHSDGLFYMCSQMFGVPQGLTLYIGFTRNHFFLSEPHAAP